MVGSNRKEKRIKIPPSRVTKTIHEDHIMRLLLKGHLSTEVFICGKKPTLSHKHRLNFSAEEEDF